MDDNHLLRQLLAEAPIEVIAQPLRAAEGRGAPAEEIAQLQEATDLALHLRAILTDRRRRERELSALYETAGDLIGIRDVERVLRAIVRRARRLLSVDTAYLTLSDEERRDTVMRVTEGTVGEEFRRLRLPFGVGLGGLVAQNARPSFTADYLNDPRYVHTADIDSAVAMERIVAIVGVPLMVADKVIGVLFGADRRPRQFTPDEVNLLESLAAHAAIAIENARLFQETRHALEELNAANAMVQAHSEAVERAAAVHERLTDVVLHGGDIDAVAAAVGQVLQADVAVLAADLRLLSSTGDPGWVEDATRTATAGLRQVQATGRTVQIAGASGGKTTSWATGVAAGADHFGVLLVRLAGDLSPVDLRTLERAAQATALLLLNQRSVAEAERRTRGEFLDDILAHARRDPDGLRRRDPDGLRRRDPDGLRRRAWILGVDLRREHAVVVASGPDRGRILDVLTPLSAECGGLVAQRASGIVCLLPDTSARHAAEVVSARVTERLSAAATVAAAGPAAGTEGVARAIEDAERCHRVLLALGREGHTATLDSLGVYSALFSRAGRQDLDEFVQATAGRVIAYDQQRGTDLVGTLEAYFEAGGNVTKAARALHVHSNTLYQRLDRIRELLPGSLDDAETALQVHLAMRITRLRREL